LRAARRYLVDRARTVIHVLAEERAEAPNERIDE